MLHTLGVSGWTEIPLSYRGNPDTFSLTNTHFATLSFLNGFPSISIFDLSTREEIHTLPFDTLQDKEIRQVVLSPLATRLITTSRKIADTKVTRKIWDVASKTLLKTFPPEVSLSGSSIFSPDDQCIVMPTKEGDAKGVTLYHIESRSQVFTTYKKNPINPKCFSPRGDKILAIQEKWGVVVLDAATGIPHTIDTGFDSSQFSAVFTPSGEQVVVLGLGAVGTFNLKSGKRSICSLYRSNNGLLVVPKSISCSSNGVQLAEFDYSLTCDVDLLVHRLYLQHSPSNPPIVTTGRFCNTSSESNFWSHSFSPDGSKMAAEIFLNGCVVWENTTPSIVETFSLPS